jgi:hypothetical protein
MTLRSRGAITLVSSTHPGELTHGGLKFACRSDSVKRAHQGCKVRIERKGNNVI